MEFDLTWILLGLPIVFALGWVASRLDLRQLRIGALQSQLIGSCVDSKQRLASGDRLVLTHQHLADRSGHLTADRQLVGFQIGVVGLDISTAMQIDPATDQGQCQGHAQQQPATQGRATMQTIGSARRR